MRDETAELRALQERAYAPGGMLNEAESRRLHELQERRRRASASDAEEPPKDAAPDAVGPRPRLPTPRVPVGLLVAGRLADGPARAAPPESNLGGSSARPAVDDATLGSAVLEQPVPASDSASLARGAGRCSPSRERRSFSWVSVSAGRCRSWPRRPAPR
ncbi:hypothetical protein [Microbacterium sp. NIBRBAC000506063]|uniref:hypothetical protein n=1 Tax=Microbacterium sp. NIBRBAC000506063 TaxID=2734618 RepID=UPI001BB7EA2C|nr:hypothetical protein [Microbacterium sp. NIBRBAC000506063]QTV79292.1 hypothetical protein KAE78_09700 [Microbacterium sp. NIBRBAC000506063]